MTGLDKLRKKREQIMSLAAKHGERKGGPAIAQ
jgi:hypothetical protein